MCRLVAACLLLGLAVCSAPVLAEEPPYLGVRFDAGKDQKVRARDVDPKAVAWEMGFRPGDVVRTIGAAKITSAPAATKAVESYLGNKEGASFEIVVEREVKDKSQPFVRKITGKVRQVRPGIHSAKVESDVAVFD